MSEWSMVQSWKGCVGFLPRVRIPLAPFLSIIIGDRVWIGTQATILKNAQIANDTIIGARSVVTKKFDKSNIAIAGNPAKIIKENVAWKK